MWEATRTYVRHILAAGAAGLAGWLTAESGTEVDPAALDGVVLAVYAILEKGLKRFTGEA